MGKATQLLGNADLQMLVYDIRPEACNPPGTTLADMENCDLVFICLPTPMNHDSSCYTELVKGVVGALNNPFKVIRSTVPIGFSRS